jgi:hypothetical protein
MIAREPNPTSTPETNEEFMTAPYARIPIAIQYRNVSRWSMNRISKLLYRNTERESLAATGINKIKDGERSMSRERSGNTSESSSIIIKSMPSGANVGKTPPPRGQRAFREALS